MMMTTTPRKVKVILRVGFAKFGERLPMHGNEISCFSDGIRHTGIQMWEFHLNPSMDPEAKKRTRTFGTGSSWGFQESKHSTQ
jgi:hypothetical protein